MGQTETASTGLYVHVPFCSIKCFYCDFVAFSGQAGSVERYLAALEREAGLYPGLTPETLYIGGGTPSELTAAQTARLLEGLAARFGPLERLRESTFEANPESLDEEKLDVLRAAGVGRLSLGLQAPQDRLLKSLGRRHGWAEFVRVWRAARSRGFSLNADLMLGLPGQSLEDAREGLERVLGLEPDHLSVYCLQVEDRTLFAKRATEVDEDLSREMLEAVKGRLEGAGFVHYEVSNFARPGRESAHNINYWLNGPYLGLGCGAAGYLGGERWQNEERLARYLERVERGERPRASSERLAGRERLGETMMLRFRLLEGFHLTPDMQTEFRPELERLLERGLIELEGGAPGSKALSKGPGHRAPAGSAGCSRCLPKARLTREGLFLANEVFREFVGGSP